MINRNEKIYSVKLFTIPENKNYNYTKFEKLTPKNVIKTFVEEGEIKPIQKILVQKTNDKRFLREIITDNLISVYNIVEYEWIDKYGHTTYSEEHHSVNEPLFTIVKTTKTYEEFPIILKGSRLTEKSTSLKEASVKEILQYISIYKSIKNFTKKLNTLYNYGESNYNNITFKPITKTKRKK